jgi:hypothetical protein
MRQIRSDGRKVAQEANVPILVLSHLMKLDLAKKFARELSLSNLVLSATVIGPLPELYFGPPYVVDKQHHPVSS